MHKALGSIFLGLHKNWVWWEHAVIPALGRWRKEKDQKSVFVSYIAGSYVQGQQRAGPGGGKGGREGRRRRFSQVLLFLHTDLLTASEPAPLLSSSSSCPIFDPRGSLHFVLHCERRRKCYSAEGPPVNFGGKQLFPEHSN